MDEIVDHDHQQAQKYQRLLHNYEKKYFANMTENFGQYKAQSRQSVAQD